MFDIKTEVASPAASKEEEDEEDEVTFSKSIVKRNSVRFPTDLVKVGEVEVGQPDSR